MERDRRGFTPEELKLGYIEWANLVESRRSSLHPEIMLWLSKWELWDLACSPMDDDARRMIRRGHYLGWWHRDKTETAR